MTLVNLQLATCNQHLPDFRVRGQRTSHASGAGLWGPRKRACEGVRGDEVPRGK
jgi:hypothetical protein